MKIKVEELMRRGVVTGQARSEVGAIKELFREKSLNFVPIVGSEGEIEGVVSSKDLFKAKSEKTPVSQVMTTKVYSIPPYEDVEIAARMMRNHKIHHLCVTLEKRIVGVLSSFDLLSWWRGISLSPRTRPHALEGVAGSGTKKSSKALEVCWSG